MDGGDALSTVINTTQLTARLSDVSLYDSCADMKFAWEPIES